MKLANLFIYLENYVITFAAKYKFTPRLVIAIIIIVLTVLFLIFFNRGRDKKVEHTDDKEKLHEKQREVYAIRTENFGYTTSFLEFDNEVKRKKYDYIFLRKKDEKYYEFTTKLHVKFKLENVMKVNMDYLFISNSKEYEKIKDDYYLSPCFYSQLSKFIEQENKKFLADKQN